MEFDLDELNAMIAEQAGWERPESKELKEPKKKTNKSIHSKPLVRYWEDMHGQE